METNSATGHDFADGRQTLEAFAEILATVPATDPAHELCEKLAAWLQQIIGPTSGADAQLGPPAPGRAMPIAKDLSSREREILATVATGLPNREIGAALFVSEKTVKTHMNHILKKLGVSNRLEATLVYHGLLEAGARRTPTQQPGGRARRRLYDAEELLTRPIEHVLEELSCTEVAQALGCARDTAWHLKRGDRELTAAAAQAILGWLAGIVATTSVSVARA